MSNSVVKNLEQIQLTIPEHVTLVAVSKTKPIESIQELYDAGQRIFGENRVQELVDKYEVLPKNVHWHLIGHLQSNKVKHIAEFIHCIQSVDSKELLSEIDKQASKHNRIIDCLLQLFIAQEETKFGMDADECKETRQQQQGCHQVRWKQSVLRENFNVVKEVVILHGKNDQNDNKQPPHLQALRNGFSALLRPVIKVPLRNNHS